MSMRFRNREIEVLLQTPTRTKTQDHDAEEIAMQSAPRASATAATWRLPSSMEPGDKPDPRWSWPAYLIDLAIRKGNPLPP